MKKLLSVVLAVCLCLSVAVIGNADLSGGYVLMNIPYDDFYAAEMVAVTELDAVSSATMAKSRVEEQVGGSYHVSADGSDVSGVIFPVYIEDLSILPTLGGTEITDETTLEITVELKGQEQTSEFTGAEALFEAPAYSWYVLSEEPAQYKTLTTDGEPAFSAVISEAAALNADLAYYFDSHVDMAMKLTDHDGVLDDANVSAVILKADDGTKVGLRHLANIHKKYDLGFDLDSPEYEALKGKRITEVQIFTLDATYSVATDLAVVDDPVLARLNGTYIELFPEFAREDLYDFWMETIASHGVDEETAKVYYSMLTDQFMGRLTGEEAVEAFGADPENMIFDCYFENGIAKLTVNGDVISGIDEEGNEIFRHTYTYLDDVPTTYFGMETGTVLHVYVTEDEDAGSFQYFAFTDDNLHDTQHIEYRYGDHLEDLGNYTESEYAYWLASGIADGYKDKLIQECITLFVGENIGGEEAEEAA